MVSEIKIPQQNRQLVALIRNSQQQVDDFVGKETFWNHFINTWCESNFGWRVLGRRRTVEYAGFIGSKL